MASALKIYDQLQFVHSMPQTNAAEMASEVRIEALPESQFLCVGLNCVIAPDSGRGASIYASTATAHDRKLDPSQKDLGGAKKVTVICDTLTVTCRWWLPQCDVVIFARKLIFTGDGSIDTSPPPWTADKAADATPSRAGGKGVSGRDAGDIIAMVGEIQVPAGSRAKRLIARGGDGQGGGHGIDGSNGRSSPSNYLGITGEYTHEDSIKDSGVVTKVKAKLNKHGDHTIIGIHRHWYVLAMHAWEGTWGTREFPEKGTDAIAPGDSGSGGNGGKIYSNHEALLALCDAPAGQPGKTPPTAKGGSAGWPRKAACYDNKYYHKHDVGGAIVAIFGSDTENDNSGSVELSVEKREVSDGQPKSAVPGSEGKSWQPELAKSGKSNVWLHPYVVPIVMDYVRRAYLGEQRAEAREMIDAYLPAFEQGMPARARNTDWAPEDEAYWTSTALELGALAQRLAAGLDYFGNPAGYAPLLSLSSAFRQYRLELDSALEVLIFTSWITAKQMANAVTGESSRAAANLLTRENDSVAKQIAAGELKVKDLDERIKAIERTQNDLADKIGVLRVKLSNQAANDVAKVAQVKFAVNLAAGLLQVVPYGQPVLGGVASMAADATDYLDEDPETVTAGLKTKVGDVVKNYKDAQKATKDLVDETKKKAQEFAKAEGKELSVDKLKALNATTESAWKTAGKGIGPALGHFKAAYEKGQVTRAKIDAQLAKLAKADPEWQSMSEELGKLADAKAELLADISGLARTLGQHAAVMAGNAAAVARLDSNTASLAAQRLGTTARQAVEDMNRRAVLTLTEALYNLVRAFESVRLEGVSVDWSNASFLTELNKAIGGKPMDKWDDDDVKARVQTLGTAFKASLRKVRNELARGLDTRGSVPETHFTIDADTIGAANLAALNDREWVTLDTLALDFVSPNLEHQLLADLQPLAIAFAEAKDKLPKQGNLAIRVELDELGIVRKGTSLYGLRLPAPMVYQCTYHFDTGSFTGPEPSKATDDLLSIVLDDMKGDVKQRLAMPSAWGTLRVHTSYSGLGRHQPPTIESISFRAKIDSQPAGRDSRVLQVASSDGFTPLMVEGAASDPVISGYFVFASPRNAVKLASSDPRRPVAKWRINRGGKREEKPGPVLDLPVSQNTVVEAEFA